MRNGFIKFLLCFAGIFISTASYACTLPALDAGSGNDTAIPPTSYITSIVANGTSSLNVSTYNPQTLVTTTLPLSLGLNSGITATGSFNAAGNITVFSAGGTLISINNGSSKLTISGATLSNTGLLNYTGGLTKLVSSSDKTSLIFDG